MKALSKSKLIAYRQCPKRLWLEVHKPDLRQDSARAQASFDVGNAVGEVARRLYDPDGSGTTIDIKELGIPGALNRTQELLAERRPIFEPGFTAGGALAFADVLLPAARGAWRMVEVKSATSVKDYYHDDLAIQANVARESGLNLSAIALAHIDGKWTYPGGGDYTGLLVENDLTKGAFGRSEEAKAWIAGASEVAALAKEPIRTTGAHCNEPFECGFMEYCRSQEPQVAHPVRWLPRIASKALKELIANGGVRSLSQVPDELLNEKQLRVKHHTLAGTVYFSQEGAAAAIKGKGLPAHFLDFETVQFAVPIWAGTRPYEQLPFQFSVHRMARDGSIEHTMFLDLTGQDPVRGLAEALVNACAGKGPVYVYYASFEASRIKEMAARFPKLRKELEALCSRLVDLLPVAEANYYHPSQEGSWSIKCVLPAAFPELDYANLDGINEGGAASAGYLEAIQPSTPAERKDAIDRELREYCTRDTYGLVRLWQMFSGQASAGTR